MKEIEGATADGRSTSNKSARRGVRGGGGQARPRALADEGDSASTAEENDEGTADVKPPSKASPQEDDAEPSADTNPNGASGSAPQPQSTSTRWVCFALPSVRSCSAGAHRGLFIHTPSDYMLTYTIRPMHTHHPFMYPHPVHAHDSQLTVGFTTTDTT